MGTWGTGSFENDTAGDWIWELKPPKKSLLGKLKDPFAYPMAAIDRLLQSDLYLEASECDEAIAAAECIAAANGSPPPNPPEELTAWLTSLNGLNPEPAMNEQAIRAVSTIRNNEQSELRELWAESEEVDLWLAAIDDLITRLTPNA